MKVLRMYLLLFSTSVAYANEQPARESNGAASVVHFQGEPIVEKEISPRPRDTQGKLTKKQSQPKTLSNLGGPLSEKTKVVGGVDQTASNPISRSQECPSSEMGDPSPRKLKITNSSSLPVRSNAFSLNIYVILLTVSSTALRALGTRENENTC
jgi:hypothetical protein